MKLLSTLSIVSAIACLASLANAQSTDMFDCNKPNAHYWMDGTLCLQKILDRGKIGGGSAEGDMGFCKCTAVGLFYQKVADHIIKESAYKGCKMFSASHSTSSRIGDSYSYGIYQCSGLD